MRRLSLSSSLSIFLRTPRVQPFPTQLNLQAYEFHQNNTEHHSHMTCRTWLRSTPHGVSTHTRRKYKPYHTNLPKPYPHHRTSYHIVPHRIGFTISYASLHYLMRASMGEPLRALPSSWHVHSTRPPLVKINNCSNMATPNLHQNS